MTTSQRVMTVMKFSAALFTLGVVSGCTLDSQSPPALTGPSEQGVSISLSATEDNLPRDGSSRSKISVKALKTDEAGKQVPYAVTLMLTLSGTPTTGGQLSPTQVTTGADGNASFEFIAPGANQNVSEVLIGATPVGTNASGSFARNIPIKISGPSFPVPSAFTWTPPNPAQFQLVTFDGSASTLDGAACSTSCTYSWTFGSEGSASGQVAQHRFQTQGAHLVTLTVTGPSGNSASKSQSVLVGASAAPTAAFTFSPTGPAAGATVFFNAATSAGANGATIAEYRWNFGNGQTATTTVATTSTTFNPAGTYVVTLTVEDSNGQTATTTRTVTVQ